NNSRSAEPSYLRSAPVERSVKSGHAACGRFYHVVELFDSGWNPRFRHSFGLGRSADTFRSTRGRMNQDQGSENKYLNASTRQLIWWQYKKHILAMVGLWLISGLYITAIFCEFLAPYNKDTRYFEATYAPPSKIRIFDEKGGIHWPFVYGLEMTLDTETQHLQYEEVS